MKLLKNHIALSVAIIGLLLWLLISIFNINYDDGGMSGIIFYVGEIFRLPFWIVDEIIFSLNSGKAISGQILISIVGGIVICIALDVFITKVFKKNTSL